MRDVYSQCNYILDPHGAVGYRALVYYLKEHANSKGIVLETAHPVKFDSVNEIIGTQGNIPASVADQFSREKHSIEIENEYACVKDVLINKIRT